MVRKLKQLARDKKIMLIVVYSRSAGHIKTHCIAIVKHFLVLASLSFDKVITLFQALDYGQTFFSLL